MIKSRTGYWLGKKRPEISGELHYRWSGGQKICQCGNKIASRSSKVKMCGECRNIQNKKRSGENHPRWGGGKPKCADCGSPLGSYRSLHCELCMGKHNRNEKNPNWKNGDEKKRIRSSPEYVSWRIAVFERDNYTCRGCGVRGCVLEAHHIKPFAEYPDLRFILNNGITYCQPCHAINDPHRRKTYAR